MSQKTREGETMYKTKGKKPAAIKKEQKPKAKPKYIAKAKQITEKTSTELIPYEEGGPSGQLITQTHEPSEKSYITTLSKSHQKNLRKFIKDYKRYAKEYEMSKPGRHISDAEMKKIFKCFIKSCIYKN